MQVPQDEQAGDESSSSNPDSEDTGGTPPSDETDPSPARIFYEPGDYASVSDCLPFEGSEAAELKIFFVDLDSAPHFAEIVEDALGQFRTIAPFNEFYQHLAFYELAINGAADYACEGTGGSLSGSGFTCDNDKIHEALNAQCTIDDIYGVLKIVITESEYGGAADEVIYVGDNPRWDNEGEAVYNFHNTVIHEVGHNLGLADLYGGGYYFDGSPMAGWPSSISREWLNLDGPGCPKWCDDFKPPSEYVISASAQCPALTDKASCVAFNRDSEGNCEDGDGDGQSDCCAWSDDSHDDYFGTRCTPNWGTEDIGLACMEGSGCFYGGAYGNNSWRPVKDWKDSIMFSPTAEKFDSVSERALRDVLRCCASSEDSSSYCAAHRNDYVAFLEGANIFKQRIGSCGVVNQEL